jgi:RNA polymerase sigma factor (sigma-70 family)
MRLLEAGEHRRLLENYVYLVEESVSLRVRSLEATEEIVQRVFLRLAAELDRGRRYQVPFRVVVWNVVHWTCRGYEWSKRGEVTLPPDWDLEGPDQLRAWEDDHDLGLLLDRLPPVEKEVLGLIYRDGLSSAQVAERLGMTAGAVYTATHHGHRKLGEHLRA